jgi:hypothetical protein
MIISSRAGPQIRSYVTNADLRKVTRPPQLPAPGLLRQSKVTSLLSRAIAVVRVWAGLNDLAENHLHPSRSWLLPAPGAGALAPAKVPLPAPLRPPGGRP